MYTAVHPAPTQRERVYSQLKRGLLAGDFPYDQRLGEVTLAKELETSRTPVREALLRLWSEGLVQQHPAGGFRPVLPDATIIHDLYEVRVALEEYALTRPLRDGVPHDRDQLEEIRAEWQALADDEPMADPDFVLLDEAFHEGLAEAGGNHALVETLHAVNERIRIVRIQDFLIPERIVATITEHLGIVTALLDGSVEQATERFSTHLAESLAVVDERSTQACLRMMRAGRSPR